MIAPPVEQHPALRVSLPQGKSAVQDWKRDSGHAPTSANLTSPVIPEEAFEDEEHLPEYSDEDGDVDMSDVKTNIPKAVEAAEATSQVQHVEHGRDEDLAPAATIWEQNDGSLAGPGPGPCPTTPPHLAAAIACPTTVTIESPASTSSPTSPRKLVKRRSNNRVSFWGSFRNLDSSPSSSSAAAAAGSDFDLTGGGNMRDTQPMRPTRQPLVRGLSSPASTGSRQPRTTTSSDAATPSRSSAASATDVDFSPIGISIPTERLLEEDFVSSLKFSNRGSLMFGSQGQMAIDGIIEEEPQHSQTQTQSSEFDDRGSFLLTPTQSRRPIDAADDSTHNLGRTVTPRNLASPTPDIRVLSPDIEMESQKVRSLYETGDGISWEDSIRHSFCERLDPTPEVSAEDDENTTPYGFPSAAPAQRLSPSRLHVVVHPIANFLNLQKKRRASRSLSRPRFVYAKIRKLLVPVPRFVEARE